MSVIPGRRRSKRRGRRARRWVFAALFLLAVLAFFVYDSSARIVSEEYEIALPALPQGFDGMRIVHLSDLHGGVWRDGDGTKLLAEVKKAAPELIVITGDLINSSAAELEPLRPLLAGLCGIAPVYFVSGNHDWASGAITELYALLEETGVRALRNEYVFLARGGDSIILAGSEDPQGYSGQKTPEELVSEARAASPESFVLLLYHRNNALESLAGAGAGLVLCGHGHGGIVRLPYFGPLLGTERNLFPKYADGLYASGGTRMFVSRGLGLVNGVPRLLNNPQVAVLTLKAG